MRKILLTSIILGLGFSIIAQNNKNQSQINHGGSDKTFPLNKAISNLTGDNNNLASPTNKPKNNNVSRNIVGTKIGETIYDLQSNSSVPRRIINHGDGTLSAIWTISTDIGPNYNNRGTGYNYFNGTTWLPTVTDRFETIRTGFPSIEILGGKELIMPHATGNYTIQQETNTTKGSTSFTVVQSGSTTPPSAAVGAIWPRIAVGGTGGNSIHLIANYSDTTVKKMGVKQPLIYSRSTDGGTSWDIVETTLPGNDSTRTLNGRAEDYSIDADNNGNVAIVLGGLGEDVTLWKSIDNGTAFIKTYIDSFRYAPNYLTGVINDTVNTNDGSLSVMLDNNGKARVVYATSRVMNTANGGVFFPGSIGLVYWDEITQTKTSIPIPLANIDLNANGNFDVGINTTASNNTNTGVPAARYGNNSLLNKPSIAMDAAGVIYVVFSLPQDADSTSDGQSFRDIWVVASQNGGSTWGSVQNITQTTGVEESFASVAMLADNYIHIVYQEDIEPGTALTNYDPDNLNNIRYLKVSTAAILGGTAGIAHATVNNTFFLSQNYPNPFTEETEISVKLDKASDVNFTVFNVMGQKMIEKHYNKYPAGELKINIDGSQLTPGVYFYTVKAGENQISKKMIAQ